MNPPSSDAALLTVHEAFLVRLARSLVGDVHEADDVVQEAYAAALERRPDPAGGLRGWLAAVVRNQARFRLRTRARRRAREVAAARPDTTSSAADLLAREELRRKVVDAVVALPDPYREVVLLRYLEELPPRQVAKRLDVPVETVRTRLWRARERLRRSLDDAAGGQKGAGLALLAPWLGRGGGGSGLGPLLGALAMTTKTKAVIVCAAALLLAAVVWQPWTSPPDAPPVGDAEPSEVADLASPDEPDPARLAGRAEEPASADPAADRIAEADVPRRLGRLRGRALYQNEGVAGVAVAVWPTRGRLAFDVAGSEPQGERHETVADERGVFVIEALPEGTYAVEALKEGFLPGHAVALVGPGAPVVPITMPKAVEGRPPAEAGVLEAQVIDAAGEPVEGATVSCTFRTGVSPSVETSDAAGRVRFAGLPYVRNDAGGGWPGAQQDLVYGFLDAQKDGLVGRQLFNVWRYLQSYPSKPIVLAASGQLQGRLVASGPLDLAGTRVRATSLMGKSGMWGPRGSPVVATSFEAPAGEDGAFVFEALLPGSYYLTIVSSRGLRVDRRDADLGTKAGQKANPAVEAYVRRITPGDRRIPTPAPPKHNDLTPVKVDVQAGETVERDLAVIAGVTIRGRVRAKASGRGVRGARVEIELAPRRRMRLREITPGGQPAEMLGRLWTDDLRNPLSWTVVTTDVRGHYVLRGAMPDSHYFIRVPPHGAYSFDQRFVETGAVGETVEVEHEVERAGAALLTVRSHGTYSLRHGDSETDAYAFQPPWSEVGVVRVPGLRPGRWSLLSAAPGRSPATPVLTTFDVRPGEETRVDAVQAGDCRVRGCVLRGGRPVEDAHVWIHGVRASRVATGEDGRFEIGFPSSTFLFGLTLSIGAPEPGRPSVYVRLVGKWMQRMRADDPSYTWEGDVNLPDGVLQVEVRDLSGEPLADAQVQLQGLAERGPGEVATGWWKGHSGVDGLASVEGLLADDYVVICILPESGMVIRRRVTVSQEEEGAKLVVRATKPATVRVRIVDERGDRVAKAYLGGQFWDPGLDPGVDDPKRPHLAREIRPKPNGRTDENGEVVFENLPPGRLRVWTSIKGVDAMGEIDVEAGEAHTLEVVVSAP